MLNENTGRRWRGGGKVTNTSDGISRRELQTPAKKANSAGQVRDLANEATAASA